MTIDNRRWSPQPHPSLNAAAMPYQPQDAADTLLDKVYSPLAATIWNDKPTTSLPTSNRTHSRFSHSSAGDEQGEGGGDVEVAAMLKLSTNLHSLTVTREEEEEDVEMEPDVTVSKLLLRAPSPGSTAIFGADLERVNAWFREELRDDTQRLMVLFSLVQLMPEWQQDFLVQLLEQRKKDRREGEEGSSTPKPTLTRPPPGLESKPPSPTKHALGVHPVMSKSSSAPPRVPSGPLSWRRNVDAASPIEDAPSPILASPAPRRASILIQQDMHNALPGHHYTGTPQFRSFPLTPPHFIPQQQQQDDTYASLFWTDLHAWLRCLRLHKYEYIFCRTNRDVFLDWSEGDLEKAGVSAMGARNKFMRLFAQIKEQQQAGR